MSSLHARIFGLIVFFLSCSISSGEDQPCPPAAAHPSPINSLSVPADIGIVRDRFEGTAPLLLILIQREGEPAGQVNYAKTIRSLAARPPLSTVPYAVVLFRPRPGESKDLADCDTITIEGADGPPDAHQETGIGRQIERYAAVIKRMKAVADAIEQERLTKELRALTSKSEDFRNNLLALDDYARFLARLGKKAGISRAEYKQLALFLTVRRLENSIEPTKAGYQKEELIDTLKPLLSKKDRAKLRDAGDALKNGELSKNTYCCLLQSIARKNGVSLERYNYLNEYIVYLQAAADLDRVKLSEECRQLRAKLERTILSRQAMGQRKVVAALKDLRVLFQLLSLSPSRSEFAYFARHKTSFSPERLQQFLSTQEEKLLDNPALREEQVMAITMMDHSLEQIRGLCALLPEIETFVSVSFAREDAQIEQAIAGLQNKRVGIGILILDGRSLDIVKTDLQKRGIHYIIISPATGDPKREDIFPQTMIKKGR